MESLLVKTSCRICLKKCHDTDPNFLSLIHIFQKLTGIIVNENDTPKKICNQCLENLLHFQNFCLKCEETEKILEGHRQNKTIIVKNEEFLFDEDLNCVKHENDFYGTGFLTEEIKKDESLSCVPSKANVYEAQTPKNDNKNEVRRKLIKRKNNKKLTARYLCCEMCGKEIHVHYIKQHMRKHDYKAKSETFFCDLCDYTCTMKDRIRFHLRQKHLKTIRYDCKYCDRSYQDLVSLKFHTSNTHTKQFSYICDVCGKGFITKCRLENHFAKHTDIRKFLCNVCGDAFKSLQYLGCHKREVHSDKILNCSDCGKSFKCKKFLRQHQQIHRPQQFFCPACPHTFSVGQTLRGHIAKSHPDLPLPPPGTHLRNLKDLDSYLLLCTAAI